MPTFTPTGEGLTILRGPSSALRALHTRCHSGRTAGGLARTNSSSTVWSIFTVADVNEWLLKSRISAEAYHAGDDAN